MLVLMWWVNGNWLNSVDWVMLWVLFKSLRFCVNVLGLYEIYMILL